jgi:hypothetical protein
MKTQVLYFRSPIFFIYLLFILFVGFFLGSCSDDDSSDPSPEQANESITQEFTSDFSGGVIELEETKLIVPPNSIPNLSNGEPSTVNFSIEHDSDLPEPLPSGMTAVGPISHFGPEGFIFSDPLWVEFKLPNNLSIDQVALVGYLPDTRNYGVFPITYYDESLGTVGTSVYELGYYFLADIEGLTRSRFAASPGGFILRDGDGRADWYPIGRDRGDQVGDWNSNDTYVKLVITNFTPKYPQDLSAWAPYNPDANGGRRYWEFSTPPRVTGWKPNHNIGIRVHGLPQGDYEANLIISHKYFQQELPECKLYSEPITFSIDGSIECDQFGCEGYDNPPLIPNGGTWMDFNCLQFHPIATEPVCTGEFQATLTWHNGANGDTDLDLRMRGPNGLDVSWENTNPGVGGIILDRDFRFSPGPAQENICAPLISAMPEGEYEIYVDHWDGLDKSYQVRIIAGDKSTSYQGQINAGDPDKIIHTFKLD